MGEKVLDRLQGEAEAVSYFRKEVGEKFQGGGWFFRWGRGRQVRLGEGCRLWRLL